MFYLLGLTSEVLFKVCFGGSIPLMKAKKLLGFSDPDKLENFENSLEKHHW